MDQRKKKQGFSKFLNGLNISPRKKKAKIDNEDDKNHENPEYSATNSKKGSEKENKTTKKAKKEDKSKGKKKTNMPQSNTLLNYFYRPPKVS